MFKNNPEHTTFFNFISGSNVRKGKISKQVNVVKVATAALKYLGINFDNTWKLDSKSVGLDLEKY